MVWGSMRRDEAAKTGTRSFPMRSHRALVSYGSVQLLSQRGRGGQSMVVPESQMT